MKDVNIIKNNYKDLNLPNHHRARKSSGNVSEHIVIAEKMIGRKLRDEEVVHHEDKNRRNNSPANLYVFKDTKHHSRYHKTGIKEKEEDYWISPPFIGSKSNPYVKICEICKKEFETTFESAMFCSVPCTKISQRVVERPSKDQLIEMTKNMKFVDIAKNTGYLSEP